MAAYINTNTASLNSQRNLNASQAGLTTALQRLSSGLRINSSKDDAAGLAIADRMTSQINGLTQAARNANDGISLAQTAEGALSSVGDSLQRIRTLALQSANSTNSASDRASLNSEVQSALAEIGRVSSTTQFNGLNLLDGTFSNSQFQVGANANQTISVTINGASTTDLGSYQATSSAVSSTAFDGTGFSVNGIAVGASIASGAVSADSATAKAAAINSVTSQTGVSATANTNSVTGAGPVAGSSGLNSGDLTINGIAVGAIASGTTAVVQGKNTVDAINAVSSQTGVSATSNLSTGVVTLTANDGRNIAISAGNSLNTAAGAQKIQNSTGLDISAGANASGHEVGTIVFGAGNEGAANGLTSGTTAGTGDTLAIGEKTYQFVTDAANVTSGNVAVVVAAGATMDVAAAALTTSINAQSTAGTATVTAAYAAGSNTLTLTSSKWGTSNITGTATVTDAGSIATGFTDTTAGTAAADGNGNTARGTLTLNSATTYTLTGSNLSNAGLASASISKATISSVDITTVAGSNNAIALVDGALAQINSQRATLGSMQNRFTSAITNLQTSSENISAARSRIQDTDFAAETAAMTRGQILQQAGTAMLAQANSLPNGVLALLRG